MEHQGPRRYAVCEISVDGKPITSRLNPYLISVKVEDNIEGTHSECHIELDDRNAELQLPPDRVKLMVALGWSGDGPRPIDTGRSSQVGGQGQLSASGTAGSELPWGGPGIKVVFSGTVSSVESGFGRRGGGRRVWIEATSGNVAGKTKEVQQGSWGDGKKSDSGGGGVGGGEIPLEQVLTEMFGKAGVTAKLSPEMKKIKRSYWRANESPMGFGERIAREVGGVFKIENGIAMLVGRTEGVNADGTKMPTIEAIWGVNLIGWRIKPYVGRPQWASSSTKKFNLNDGIWENMKKEISGGEQPFGRADAGANMIMPVVDSAVGEQQNKGQEATSVSRRGTGWVLINGEPDLKANGKVHIINARPGIDGMYTITMAEHNYTRGVGYTTRCNVKEPKPDYHPSQTWTNPPQKSVPPEERPTSQHYTEEQRNAMRQYYEDNNMPVPDWLTQSDNPFGPGYTPPPKK